MAHSFAVWPKCRKFFRACRDFTGLQRGFLHVSPLLHAYLLAEQKKPPPALKLPGAEKGDNRSFTPRQGA